MELVRICFYRYCFVIYSAHDYSNNVTFSVLFLRLSYLVSNNLFAIRSCYIILIGQFGSISIYICGLDVISISVGHFFLFQNSTWWFCLDDSTINGSFGLLTIEPYFYWHLWDFVDFCGVLLLFFATRFHIMVVNVHVYISTATIIFLLT